MNLSGKYLNSAMEGNSINRAEVIIKAFRAIDEPDLCQKFIEGHERVLLSIGVTKVTSSSYEWTQNPAAFVVLCLTKDGARALGGARVHVCGGNQQLPLISGVEEMDSSVHGKIEEKKREGTAELCGLWNSIEVAGMGIAAIYVVRSTVAIIKQLGITSCFALCSPQGARISMDFGYQLRDDIGNKGTFYYPKEDLLATMVFLPNAVSLETTPEKEKAKILELREKPNLLIVEESRGKTVEIQYQLHLPRVDTSVYDFGLMAN
jgi:hypothetical protein